MRDIPLEEIVFHPHSFADQGIRLFSWKGEVYRAMDEVRAKHIRQLMSEGILNELAERGLLIGTEITDLSISGFSMVVHQKTLPLVAYPSEWPPRLFKDAILAFLELAISLSTKGYTLADGHPWNVVVNIDTCRPLFVDIGSIQKVQSDEWSVYDAFCRFFLYPLVLMSSGHDAIARLLMCEFDGVSLEILQTFTAYHNRKPDSSLRELRYILPEGIRQMVRSAQRKIQSRVPYAGVSLSRGHTHLLERLRDEVEPISLPTTGTRQLSQDQKEDGRADQSIEKEIFRELGALPKDSILCIGTDSAIFAKQLAKEGHRVLLADTDLEVLERVYMYAKETKIPLLPLVMDFTSPTPSRGLLDYHSVSAFERLQCDRVLAIGLVEHAVRHRCLSFNHIAYGLAAFCRRSVLVRFQPLENLKEPEFMRTRFPWYTAEEFERALKFHFRDVNVLVRTPENLILFLCEK